VKSTQPFHGGLRPIAKKVIYVDSNGPLKRDPAKIAYTKVEPTRSGRSTRRQAARPDILGSLPARKRGEGVGVLRRRRSHEHQAHCS
jgi:hypothetical protein